MAKINRRNVGAANAASTNKEETSMKKNEVVTENAPEKEQQTVSENDTDAVNDPETPVEENKENNLPAEVSEKKPGFFSKEAREERAAVKAAKRAEKLAKNEALRKEGHVVKAAVGDLAIAAGEGAAKALKIAGGVAIIGGVVAGGIALANAKASKEEESGEDPEEPEIIGTDTYEEHKEEETETDKVEITEF